LVEEVRNFCMCFLSGLCSHEESMDRIADFINQALQATKARNTTCLCTSESISDTHVWLLTEAIKIGIFILYKLGRLQFS
jgi:hypothetical protein